MIKPAPDAWVAHRRPKPQAHWRLYCLPHAGGSASVFRDWAAALPPSIDVWPIQYPGRENRFREPAFRNLLALVEALGEALAPSLDGPYALFGHSMGGLIGFELARWLTQHARGPAHLFVSGSRPPHRAEPSRPLHALPDGEFVEALRALNGTPEAVLQNAELMELFAPVLRADFEAVETYDYQPSPPLDIPLSVFGGEADPRVSQALVAGWEAHTRARFRFRLLPGEHFFINTARPQLLAAIVEDLHSL